MFFRLGGFVLDTERQRVRTTSSSNTAAIWERETTINNGVRTLPGKKEEHETVTPTVQV